MKNLDIIADSREAKAEQHNTNIWCEAIDILSEEGYNREDLEENKTFEEVMELAKNHGLEF